MQRLTLSCVLVLAVACGDDGSGDTTTTAGGSTTAADTGATSSSGGAGEESSGAATSTTSATGSSSDTLDGSSTAADSSGETGAAAPTWDNFAESFFESYCWECHGAGDALRDYTMLSVVESEAASIRCGTAPVGSMLDNCAGEPPAGQFPVGATLPTDEERQMLVDWIDAGLPEN
ncbi:MAG: hypothetical protein AAF799_24385 [Myxococcota bacterium]